MREKNDLAAFVGNLRYRRRDSLDARPVGHPAAFGRDVEIDAQQDAFSCNAGVVEGAEWVVHVSASQASDGGDAFQFPAVLSRPRKRAFIPHASVRAGLSRRDSGPRLFAGATSNSQISFAIATAVSAMRLEKPHSLSYQES